MKYSFEAAAWKKQNCCFWSSKQSYCVLVWFSTSNRRVWLRKHWAKSPVWPPSPSISEEMETKSEKIQISSYRMPTLFTFFFLIYKTEMQFFLKPTMLKDDCIAAKHACKNTWCGFLCFTLLVSKAELHFLREPHAPDILADGTSLLLAIPPWCLWFLCSSYYFLLFSHWCNSSCSTCQQQVSHQPFNHKASADQGSLLNYLACCLEHKTSQVV